VHRCHRVPSIAQLPRPELGSQLTEPGRQQRGILGGELPGHAHLGPVAVGVLDRHTGLPRPA